MDYVTKELNNLIVKFNFDNKTTDAILCKKIRIDYFLMITIATAWDIKHSSMKKEEIDDFLSCLQRPETGKMIRLIDSVLNLNKSIVNIFDLYKKGRNLRFAHTTFDEYEAKNLDKDCEFCWNGLIHLAPLEDGFSEIIRKLYNEQNDFYYISKINNKDVLVQQFGNKRETRIVPIIEMKARFYNKKNDIKEGDLFILVDNSYIKISPFIQFNEHDELFMMLMDIEKYPLAFKMAYVYRRENANDSAIYCNEFPIELLKYFPEENKKIGKNGISLNRFSQYSLFEQQYYKDVHRRVQEQLDMFIKGNMAYGAVRGVGGVGKTSAVFIWMNRILNNETNILDEIRKKFNLRKIFFLSAKKKIYLRNMNQDNLSYFDQIESDVHNYNDVVKFIYEAFHPSEKDGIQFEDKEKWLKNYSNNSQGILIIIDDYESLDKKSRDKLQVLKDYLNPNVVKILITTRFASKESKDIVVDPLDEKDCSNMTDHIFGSQSWKQDITPKDIHNITGGLPLLIWYSKAYFNQGQLSRLAHHNYSYSGPEKGLEAYLYDNFIECFDNVFTKNFIMIATRHYKLHSVMQIQKKIALFLCLENFQGYKMEDEEFYFKELTDLKLISVNQSTGAVDFSPLRNYMDKTSKQQEPRESYQDYALKIITQLDEEKFNELHAVIESSKYLEDSAQRFILTRIIDFSQNDDKIKSLAIKELFNLTDDKIKLYELHTQIFQNDRILVEKLLDYLLSNRANISNRYELIKDFIKAISISIDNQEQIENVADKCIKLSNHLLQISLKLREDENISNNELALRSDFLKKLVAEFIHYTKNTDNINEFNETMGEVDLYCS